MLDIISSLGMDAVIAVLKGIGVGLLVGIAVTFLAVKLGLFRRDNKKWNAAVKLYYIYIPLIFIMFFCGRFILSAGQDNLHSLMDSMHPDVTQATVQGAQYAMEAATGDGGKDISPNEIITLVGTMATELTDKGLSKLPQGVSNLVGPIKPVVTKVIADMLKKQLVKIIAENTGISNNSVKELMQIGIVAALEGGLFMDVVRLEVDRRLEPLSGSLLKMLLILMLPVALETAFYRYRRKKLAAKA